MPSKHQKPSARTIRDQRLATRILEVYTQNDSCYGVRKIWHELNRHYQQEFGTVAKCTVERLMRQLGIQGVTRGEETGRLRVLWPLASALWTL